MKVVILAGGLPSAITDDYEGLPKPMVEIGERPLLWHIMKLYSYYGYKDFIICSGYKGDLIKRYFMDYYIYQSDITIDLQTNQIEIHKKHTEDWNVTVADTGLRTAVFERIRRIQKYIGKEAFIVSYGDCISDINVPELVAQYHYMSRLAVAAVAKPTGRHQFIPVTTDGIFYKNHENNSNKEDAWVNACNMVFSPEIFPYLEHCTSETQMFERMKGADQISAYCHKGFWRTIETMRDRLEMEQMWQEGNPPWKIWKD